MKTTITAVTICTLLSIGALQTTCFASEMIPNEIIETERKKCQVILPALTEKLNSWVEHYNQSAKWKIFLDAYEFQEFAKCVPHVESMDKLSPDIGDLSAKLFGALGDLQVKYPAQKTQITTLLGINEQVVAIAENIALFCAHNSQNKTQ